MGDQHIEGSPFRLHVSGAVAGMSFATSHGLPDLRAGSPAAIHVKTRTAQGQPVRLVSPSLELQVSLDGQEVTISEQGLGEYAIQFLPTRAGPYLIDLLLHDVPMKGSPFSLTVLPGEIDPQRCTTEGSGSEIAIRDQPASFTIATADRCGNRLIQGGANFEVMVYSVEGSDTVHASVTDRMDGTYVVMYTVEHSGPYQVLVFVPTHAWSAPSRCPINWLQTLQVQRWPMAHGHSPTLCIPRFRTLR
jgi:hypothetical protein